MNFEPMFDKVLLKKIKQSETTKGGLVLPGTVTEKSWKGEVIAVGQGKLLDDGCIIEPHVKVGDEVLFSKPHSLEIVLDEETYYLIKECDLLGVFKKE